jgi:hypothetical protein
MENNKIYENKVFLAGITISLLFGFAAGVLLMPYMSSDNSHFHEMSMEDKRKEFISEKEAIFGELIAGGKYSCCLDKACTYCIEKTPGHGEGAACYCLADVVEGRHPCGECIGEIMEGHGNPFLAKYFAIAIAEEMGGSHLDEFKQMMTEKYDISIDEQL